MKAIVVEAPNEIYGTKYKWLQKLFLAGGITNCPDWQKEAIELLKDQRIIIYNPRRENFPIGNPNAADEQITWEYDHLKRADIISFWFSRGSLNPIVLYELGRWGNSSNKPIVIGVDPEYERIQDVKIQTSLSRKYIKVHENFLDFIDEIKSRISYPKDYFEK